MGLAEKRIIKEFETTVYPGLKQKIDEAAGFAVPMEVRWETLAKEERYSHQWLGAWQNVYFQPIIDAFKHICADDMGKEALKGALKQIVVQNTKDSYSSDWASFESGVLTLDYQFANIDAVRDRMERMKTAVEKAL